MYLGAGTHADLRLAGAADRNLRAESRRWTRWRLCDDHLETRVDGAPQWRRAFRLQHTDLREGAESDHKWVGKWKGTKQTNKKKQAQRRGKRHTHMHTHLPGFAIQLGGGVLLQYDLWLDWPWAGRSLQWLDGECGIQARLHVVVAGAFLSDVGRRPLGEEGRSQSVMWRWAAADCEKVIEGTCGRLFGGQVEATPPRPFDWPALGSVPSLRRLSSALRAPSGNEASGWLTNL